MEKMFIVIRCDMMRALFMLISLTRVQKLHSLPYMLISSTRSKCFSVVAPNSQTISIDYDAPDLKTDDETLKSVTKRNEPSDKVEYNNEGLDTQWNKRMKERLEKIKSKKLRDTSITVSQKGATASGSDASMDADQSSRYDPSGLHISSGRGRIREELYERTGRIEFLTDDSGGKVEICVQSILASRHKPKRFHLRVDIKSSGKDNYDEGFSNDEEDGTSANQRSLKDRKTKDPEHLQHMELTTKMSRLERDLQTLQNRVKACLNNADYNKEQELTFHAQSVSMNKAAVYWPLIQLAVLVITGFTQANHIIRYLKMHHVGL